MRDIDITNFSNTILIILWVILPKLYRIWKKKNIFDVYDIPFDLLPIFILSNGWMRFVIWLILYVVFILVLTLIFSKGKVILFNEKQSSQNNDTNSSIFSENSLLTKVPSNWGAFPFVGFELIHFKL